MLNRQMNALTSTNLEINLPQVVSYHAAKCQINRRKGGQNVDGWNKTGQ